MSEDSVHSSGVPTNTPEPAGNTLSGESPHEEQVDRLEFNSPVLEETIDVHVEEQWATGHLDLTDMPDQTLHGVKVFLLATPDMWDEQNTIMTIIRHKLLKYCRMKYNLDIQIVAPHWHPGVDEKNYTDDVTSAGIFALNTGKQAECNINVLLLGEKYGWRPPPSRIGSREFEFLIRHLRRIDINGPAYLRNYYQEDKNEHPSVCVFDRAKLNVSQDEGQEAEIQMHPLVQLMETLRVAARTAVEAGHISHDDYDKYSCSVVDRETEAILADELSQEKTVCFIRKIQDLEDNIFGNKRAAEYCDLTPEHKIDKEAHERMIHLRDVVRTSLAEDHVFTWDIPCEISGVSLDLHCQDALYSSYLQALAGKSHKLAITQYKAYVEEMCNKVEEVIKHHIDEWMAHRGERSSQDNLKMEVLKHWKAATKVPTVYGRDAEMKTIMRYLRNDSEQAMLIHGESGIGKTSLLCECVKTLNSVITNKDEEGLTKSLDAVSKNSDTVSQYDFSDISPVIVFRMLDNPCKPYTAQNLLWSIACQIQIAYGGPSPDPGRQEHFEDLFYEALEQATELRPVIVVLDGVDHITTPITMESLGWLPDILPPHVKIVLSFSSDSEDGLLDEMLQRIVLEDNILELDVLDEQAAIQVIQDRLGHRGLADYQVACVTLLLQTCTHPCFLHHLARMLSQWPSHLMVDPECPPVMDSVDGIIVQFLEQLEKKHGELQVTHSFSYLCASNIGLAQDELLDVLSMDDTLLSYEIYTGDAQPNPRRFPEILWLLLYHDIQEYLGVTSTDSKVLLQWKSRRFQENIIQRYFVDVDHVKSIHSNLANYFLGTYGGNTSKKFGYKLMRLFDEDGNITEEKLEFEGSQCRHLPQQPLLYQSLSYKKTESAVNLRKMAELPMQLLKSDSIDELKAVVLFNYSWWHARIEYSSLAHLVDDLDHILETPAMISEKELEMVIEVLQDCSEYIEKDLGHLRAELTSRLLQYTGTYPNISHLLWSCDYHGYRDCRVTPLTPFSDALAEEVHHSLAIDTGYDGHVLITTTSMPDFVVSYTIPDRLSVWNMRSGDKVPLECLANTYYSNLLMSKYREWIFATNDGKTKYSYQDDTIGVDVYDLDKGKRVWQMTHKLNSSQKIRKLYRLSCLQHKGVVYETYNYVGVYLDAVRLFHLKTGEEVMSDLPWPQLLTNDEKFLFISDPDTEGITIHDLSTSEILGTLAVPKHVTAMAQLKGGSNATYLLTAVGSSGTLCLFDLDEVHQGEELHPFLMMTLQEKKNRHSKGGVGQFVISPNDQTALAVFIYSSGTNIHQVNYVFQTERLDIKGSFKSVVGEIPFFSADGLYLFHWQTTKNCIEIYDTESVTSLACFLPGVGIQHCIQSPSPSHILLVTKQHILEVDITKVIKKSEMTQMCVQQESEGSEKIWQLRRQMKKKMNDEEDSDEEVTHTARHALLADLDLTSSTSWSDLEQKVSVKVICLDLKSSLVESHTMNLHRGIHFTEFDLPSFTSDLVLTPDGRHLILLCDQVHIWDPKKSTVILALPLKEKHGYTRLIITPEGTQTGRGELFIKDVSMEGVTLEKGAFVFCDLGHRNKILYEAKGGEIIQRVPAVARVYDIITEEVKCVVRLQNEKLVTCTDKVLVTGSTLHRFTNLYSLETGEQICIIDVEVTIATFSPSGEELMLVASGQQQVFRIHSGRKYQQINRLKVVEHMSEGVTMVTTCPQQPQVVVVSVHRPPDDNLEFEARNSHLRVDVVKGCILSRVVVEGDVIHISSDGTKAVTSNFAFYDLITGELMCCIHNMLKPGRTLSPHSSYLTNDGKYLVCLDTEKGLIIVANDQGVIQSTVPYHAGTTTLEKLYGRSTITAAIPLYGGYECVVLDGSGFLKQFALQTFPCWRSLHKQDILDPVPKSYSSVVTRANMFQQHYANQSPVEYSSYLHKLNSTKVVNARSMTVKQGYLGPIARHLSSTH